MGAPLPIATHTLPSPHPTPVIDESLETIGASPRPPDVRKWAGDTLDEVILSNVSTADVKWVGGGRGKG